MKRIRIPAAALFAILCSVVLSGCGEKFPALTQEEYDLIVDYSAGVLSKYNMGNGDKLTKLPPLQAEEEAGTPIPGADIPEQTTVQTKPAVTETSKTEQTVSGPTVKEQTESEPAGGGDSQPDESPIVMNDGSGDDAEENTEPSGEEQTAEIPSGDSMPIESDGNLLQQLQSGIGISFNGYYVLNSYPEGGNSYTGVTAEAGKKLLILSFTLSNGTSGDVNADILNGNPTFTLYINGQPVAKQLVTALDNDLGTYIGTIPAGGNSGAVLCFQVQDVQAKAIDTMSVKLNYHGEEQFLSIE
ncbi:MAG: hypothetical protein K5696_11525 [Lachnospiraceae bacterium]|nr:hypothetical protein [Lachnospiraceae bacterium]